MRLRAALVGRHTHAAAWLEAMACIPEIELVGIAAPTLHNAWHLAKESRSRMLLVATDLDGLQYGKPDILIDCSSPERRFPVVSAGLAAGYHVLSDGPVATTLDRAVELRRTAHAAGRMYAAVPSVRYRAALRSIAHLIMGGVIGDLSRADIDIFLPPHFAGVSQRVVSTVLQDLVTQVFGAVSWVAGSAGFTIHHREWVAWQSQCRRKPLTTGVFDFLDGSLLTYRAGWSWRLTGRRGTIVWEGDDDIRVTLAASPLQRALYKPLPPAGEPLLDDAAERIGLLRDFVDAVRQRRDGEVVDNLSGRDWSACETRRGPVAMTRDSRPTVRTWRRPTQTDIAQFIF